MFGPIFGQVMRARLGVGKPMEGYGMQPEATLPRPGQWDGGTIPPNPNPGPFPPPRPGEWTPNPNPGPLPPHRPDMELPPNPNPGPLPPHRGDTSMDRGWYGQTSPWRKLF